VNLGLHSEKPVSNCLSYGTAIMRYLRHVENESRRDKIRNQTNRFTSDFKPLNETAENVYIGNEGKIQARKKTRRRHRNIWDQGIRDKNTMQ
jgi:hypothetical protein